MFYFTEPNDFTDAEKASLIAMHTDNVVDMLCRDRSDKSVDEETFKAAKREAYISQCAEFPAYVNVTWQMMHRLRG